MPLFSDRNQSRYHNLLTYAFPPISPASFICVTLSDWLIQFLASVLIAQSFSSFRSPLFDWLISFSWSVLIGQTNMVLSKESFVNCSTYCKSVNFDLKCVPCCWLKDWLRGSLFVSSLRLNYEISVFVPQALCFRALFHSTKNLPSSWNKKNKCGKNWQKWNRVEMEMWNASQAEKRTLRF